MMDANHVLNSNDPQCRMFDTKSYNGEQNATKSSSSSVSEDSSEDKLLTEEKKPMISSITEGGILNPIESSTSLKEDSTGESSANSPNRASSRTDLDAEASMNVKSANEPSAISGKLSYVKSDPEEEQRSNAVISHYEPSQSIPDINNINQKPEERISIPPISSLDNVKPHFAPMEPKGVPPFNGYTYSRIPVYSIMQIPHTPTVPSPFGSGVHDWPTAPTDAGPFATGAAYSPPQNTQPQSAQNPNIPASGLNQYPYNVHGSVPGHSMPNIYSNMATGTPSPPGQVPSPHSSTGSIPQSTEYYDQQGYQTAVHEFQPGINPMIGPVYPYRPTMDSGYEGQYPVDMAHNMYRQDFMNPNSKVYQYNNPNHGAPPEGPRRRGNLPKEVTRLLKNWLLDNIENPYPNEEDKMRLVEQTGLSLVQISNWFINARRRSIPASQRKRKLNHGDRK